MRLSTMILSVRRWRDGGRDQWVRAERLGFHAAYTYDHLSWRSLRDRTWFGAIPTLTAAAGVTERLRLGTMVTSPNFRHPVTLAKELISLDDISGGRITLGIGAGAAGFDATVLGQEVWPPKERADRFAEFVPLLDRLLTEDVVSYDGTFYSAFEARGIPGCVQRPRIPFAVAATGPKALRVAARHGQAWVTTGDMRLWQNGGTPEQSLIAIRDQLARLGDTCAAEGRDVADLDRILVTGFTPDRPLDSLDAFVEFAGQYKALGFTEIVLHAPVPDSMFEASEEVFERIATEGLAQLTGIR
ncbi:LLM class flavin-dependent oxidoreductase [Streptomyces sp. NPDC051569]|uniref:LLM class flavin-dependent oxidoreductase n=1 Tax=Streptomyces sp. NPDC051569 TaxID=3365661 RepID=UPI0037BAD66F